MTFRFTPNGDGFLAIDNIGFKALVECDVVHKSAVIFLSIFCNHSPLWQRGGRGDSAEVISTS